MLQSNRILKRKIRLVQSEVRMLQSYYDDCILLLKEYEVEFSQDISYFKKAIEGDDKKEAPDLTDQEITDKATKTVLNLDEHMMNKPEEPEALDNTPPWAKKLYKKIALATHPDKVSGHSLENALIQKFLRAGKAFEKGELEELVAIAIDLNLEIDVGDEAMHIMLKKQRDSLKEKITVTESSLAWIWCENYGETGLKARILSSQFEHTVNIEDLKDMISKREKENASR